MNGIQIMMMGNGLSQGFNLLDQKDSNVFGCSIDSNFLYTCKQGNLKTYTYTSGGVMTEVDSYSTGTAFWYNIYNDGTFLFVACGGDGLRCFSVDGSGNITLNDTLDNGGNYLGVWGDGSYIYAATDNTGLRSYSVDGSGNLTLVDTENIDASYEGVYTDSSYIYTANDIYGIRSHSQSSGIITSIDVIDNGTCNYVYSDGTYVYGSHGDGIRSYSVDGSGNMTLVDTDTTITDCRLAYKDGSVLYVPSGAGVTSLGRYTVDGSGNITYSDQLDDTSDGYGVTVDNTNDVIYLAGTDGISSYKYVE